MHERRERSSRKISIAESLTSIVASQLERDECFLDRLYVVFDVDAIIAGTSPWWRVKDHIDERNERIREREREWDKKTIRSK